MNALKFLTITAALGATFASADAMACSCIFTCENSIIVDQKLPAGAKGIYWYFAGRGIFPAQIDAQAITLEKKDAQGNYQVVEHEITDSYSHGKAHLIAPKAGFRAGEFYRLTTDLNGWDAGCNVELQMGSIPAQRTVEVEIVDVTPGKTLSASVTPPQHDRIDFESDSLCNEKLRAVYSDLTIELPPELKGMERTLHYEIRVDNEAYVHAYSNCAFQYMEPGALTWNRLTTRLAALCEEVPNHVGNSAISTGTHSVTVGAFLPGNQSLKWSSDPIEVTLNCKDPVGGDMGAGDMSAEDMPFNPFLDMSSPSSDMSNTDMTSDMTDSSQDMNTTPTPTQEEGTEGCAQTGATPPLTLVTLLLSMFALGLFRRRANNKYS